jgi:hypothetical protein
MLYWLSGVLTFISSIGVSGTNGLPKSCPKSNEATETLLRFRVEYVLETLARDGVRFIMVHVGVVASVTLPYSLWISLVLVL